MCSQRPKQFKVLFLIFHLFLDEFCAKNGWEKGLYYLLYIRPLSCSFLDLEMSGSSSRIWSINLSMSVLYKDVRSIFQKCEKFGELISRNWFRRNYLYRNSQLCHSANLSHPTYSGVKFSKSIDLVSISPFFLRYSRMMPGGWYRR